MHLLVLTGSIILVLLLWQLMQINKTRSHWLRNSQKQLVHKYEIIIKVNFFCLIKSANILGKLKPL